MDKIPKSGKNLEGEPLGLIKGTFADLHKMRGLGEDPVYNPPILTDRPRYWSLDQWKSAPRDLGYSDFLSTHWKGIRLLKDPDTQRVYHSLLWELKPKTIIELGVYSGGSLVWFRDLSRSFGFHCKIFGLDNDLSRCQISESEMDSIALHTADCNFPETIVNLIKGAEHPILFVDDAHWNTFNILKEVINNGYLQDGDYVAIEDTMGLWNRYSPNVLQSHLKSFSHVMAMDLIYSNLRGQLNDGVFKIKIKSNAN